MKAGEFREDLYYRIAAFPIVLPPLRENREDLPLLAEHFLDHAAEKTDKQIAFISEGAMQRLMNYNWPGNVRELENVINRAVLLETSSILQLSSLPPGVRSAQNQPFTYIHQSGNPTSTEIPTLEEAEKHLLERALKVTGHNISETARTLGIGRVTVYRKLEKYNLIDSD
jgi:two-component system response regulator HydG